MSVRPLVSIVTPSFNQGQYIRATIESVLSQDYSPIEYIIMDGGSTDATAAVVKDYASRLTWISEKDNGQSHAINKGFRMARGEIVAWLNSDDVILPGAVSKGVLALAQNPLAGAVYGDGYQIDEQGNVRHLFPWTEPFNLWKLVHVLDYVLQQSLYMRKSVLEEVGYVDESLNWGMDWDLLMRIGKHCPIAYVPEPLGSIREYATAKSFAGGWRRFHELLAIMRRHGTHHRPPGFWFYGLSTGQQVIANWLETNASFAPDSVRHNLNRAIGVVVDPWIRSAYSHSQGFYRDGWAGPRLLWMLPRAQSAAHIVIAGSVPDHGGGRKSPQVIKVSTAGRVLAQAECGPGDFVITADAPPELRSGAVELLVEASSSFVPARFGKQRDNRRLAYMLRSVDVQETAV